MMISRLTRVYPGVITGAVLEAFGFTCCQALLVVVEVPAAATAAKVVFGMRQGPGPSASGWVAVEGLLRRRFGRPGWVG